MAAIEILEKEGQVSGEGKGRFKFVRYERSSEVEDISDSSVSYASAYAVL
jgi:predicted class III extradiol MEMO1 family dioxygenase